MKYVHAVFEMVTAFGVIYMGSHIAVAMNETVITAPMLVMIAAALLALHFIGRSFLRSVSALSAIGTRPGTQAMAAMAGAQPIRGIAHFVPRAASKLARHEAAHAVVAHALGHDVISASLVPEGASGGRVAWRHRDSALSQASVDHVAVAFAGPLAEGTGDMLPDRGDDDYSALLRTAIAASITDPEGRTPTEILDAGTRAARRLVIEHAGSIEALASELVATGRERDLGGAEIRELLQRHGVLPEGARSDHPRDED